MIQFPQCLLGLVLPGVRTQFTHDCCLRHILLREGGRFGRISGLLNFLLAYFSFLWKKELHVAAGDLSGTKDIARRTRMVAWMDSNAWGLESEALGAGAVRIMGLAQRRGAAEGFCGTQFSVQASRARTDRTAAGARIQKEWSANAWVGEGRF